MPRTLHRLAVAVVATCLAISGAAGQTFTPPSDAARRAAIGPVDDLPAATARAFEPSPAFGSIRIPGADDWLAIRDEVPQTFVHYAGNHARRPAEGQRVYLQPLGALDPSRGPTLDELAGFLTAFLGLDVQVLPPLDVDALALPSRRGDHGLRQLLTGAILSHLDAKRPADAFAVIGVTLEDLYPGDAWNYVFGQADVQRGVGVFSFLRYGPPPGATGPPGWHQQVRLRAYKVLAHEATHLFGIHHCTWFDCLINGANNLAEADRHPLHLCPVDLRKLHHAAGFEILPRYRQLHDVLAAAGFDAEATWYRRRLDALESGKTNADDPAR